MRETLVTGVAGFIGSHLAERLLADGHRVIGIDCFTDYYPRAIKEQNLAALRAHAHFTFVEEDLLRADLVSLAGRGVEWVFHLAAQAGVRASWGNSFEIYTQNNILATQRLLEAARNARVSRFVFASSSSIYGDAETLPTREEVTPLPISPYGVTKLACEHLARLYFRHYGVPTVALRYFTVYGPRQRPDMAFHKFIRAALENREIVVYGDGEQTRDFTFVADAVDGTVRAAQYGEAGAVYNLGGGARVSVNAVLHELEAILGKRVMVRYAEPQAGDVRHTSADCTRAARVLGYVPRMSLREGLRAEVEWVRGQKAEVRGQRTEDRGQRSVEQ